jgi:hypothetical protein
MNSRLEGLAAAKPACAGWERAAAHVPPPPYAARRAGGRPRWRKAALAEGRAGGLGLGRAQAQLQTSGPDAPAPIHSQRKNLPLKGSWLPLPAAGSGLGGEVTRH